MKKKVFRPVRNSLQVRECVEEMISIGRSLVAAIELNKFQSGLLLKPKERRFSSRRLVFVTVKVYTPRVG